MKRSCASRPGRAGRHRPGGEGGRRPFPSYQKTSGVSGNLNSVGSDTMNNMMTLWAEAFLKMYPNVKVQVEGKGSSTAPPALIAGTAQFGPMSRAMRATEIDQFEAQVRLQAHPAPHLLRRARRLREQGQPDREADPRPGGRGLLEDAAQAAASRTSPPGASSASPATGRPGRSASTAATPPAAPTASSRSTRSATATTRTP